MPKAPRSRISRAHAPAPNSTKRTFAISDNATRETVVVGSEAQSSANDILKSLGSPEAGPTLAPVLKPPISSFEALASDPSASADPRDRRIAQRRLEHAHKVGEAPYSRSHRKRLNRRKREQLANTGMTSVEEALGEVEKLAEERKASAERAAKIGKGTASGEMIASGQQEQPKAKAGARSRKSLTHAQRAAILKTESARLPNILKHPSFAANPFETIRTHAMNTVTMLADGDKRGKAGR